MPPRRDPRSGGWFFRKVIRMPDGRKVRIFGVPQSFGRPNTKVGTQEAERLEIHRVLTSGVVKPTPPPTKAVPRLKDFSETFLQVSRLHNKPSSVASKEGILCQQLLPAFGELPLDEITYAKIEDFKLAKVGEGLTKKTVNNYLAVLRRLLVIARKRGHITVVPELEWLKALKPTFDFFNFEEARRLIEAADPAWRSMLVVALRTGMRQSELVGLRWEDVDLKAGRLLVRQAIVRGHVGPPKNGRPREIPLSDDALSALKAERHLRGPLVFCEPDGRHFTHTALKWPIWRACKRAGLRLVQWHVLRHTFASHLAMRGAPFKVIQELMGHATVQMTMRYAHLCPEVARDHVKLLDAKSERRGSGVAAAGENGSK